MHIGNANQRFLIQCCNAEGVVNKLTFTLHKVSNRGKWIGTIPKYLSNPIITLNSILFCPFMFILCGNWAFISGQNLQLVFMAQIVENACNDLRILNSITDEDRNNVTYFIGTTDALHINLYYILQHILGINIWCQSSSKSFHSHNPLWSIQDKCVHLLTICPLICNALFHTN